MTERVNELLNQAGWDYKDWARVCQVTMSAAYRWAKGEREPSRRALELLIMGAARGKPKRFVNIREEVFCDLELL